MIIYTRIFVLAFLKRLTKVVINAVCQLGILLMAILSLSRGIAVTFIRKWDYYLSYCEAAFLMRNINTVQVVYTRPNNPNLRF